VKEDIAMNEYKDERLNKLAKLLSECRNSITAANSFSKEFMEVMKNPNSRIEMPEGNLGTACVFDDAGGCECFIAASYKAFDQANEVARSDWAKSIDCNVTLVTVGDSRGGMKMIDCPSGKDSDHAIRYLPTDSNRSHDSECLLINAIAQRIADGKKVKQIVLTTELPPCWSCRHIILYFLLDNRNTEMHVNYEEFEKFNVQRDREGFANLIDGQRLKLTCGADEEQQARS
jgi:hypothetical protein